MATLLLIIALALILGPLVTYAIYTTPRQQISYIPLPARCLPEVVRALELPNGPATLIDLGCGDGRVLAAALEAHPKLRALGVEINPVVALLARWRLRRFGNRVRIQRRNFFDTDLSSATHLFTYLNDPTMAALEPKLPKGVRVVACDFPLPHRRPSRTVKIGEPWQLGQKLYIYKS